QLIEPVVEIFLDRSIVCHRPSCRRGIGSRVNDAELLVPTGRRDLIKLNPGMNPGEDVRIARDLFGIEGMNGRFMRVVDVGEHLIGRIAARHRISYVDSVSETRMSVQNGVIDLRTTTAVTPNQERIFCKGCSRSRKSEH